MESKRLAGEKAVDFVEEGMVLGLGTGSTVYFTLVRLAERVKQGLNIKGVPTSIETERIARHLGIPLVNSGEAGKIDVAIDGADAIDSHFTLIKGGGGALLREKMIALAADRFIVVADPGKFVTDLTHVNLPVEIIPFARELTEIHVKGLGCTTRLRMKDNKPFITDNGNFILDCSFSEIIEPNDLQMKLNRIPGVVENGLFAGLADQIITVDHSGKAAVLET
ncbi:ribose-5-phosphate isomerase RpiA [Peribacillus deserti]|uniref:Ribose-5-phosphate isomerase A n=1 Tax=Peribacillus deserti TaxID=673318 RepID=A0A2N5M0D2_9BACI|nr:ribose-5-phosphate isomerase RpiA [Peribacillus deserti]PLT27733.1 ribose 5-phosphate isomerase A [Peribacillus deserti]